MSGKGEAQASPVSPLEVAMAYVQVEAELPDSPEALRLEELLGGVEDSWRFVVRLWAWCLTHAETGRLANVSSFALARACHYHGEHAVFQAALLETGFLRQDGEALVVCGWEKRYRDLVRERTYWRARKAAQRASRRGVPAVSPSCPAGVHGDNTGTTPGQTGDVPPMSHGTSRSDIDIESEKETKTKTETLGPTAPVRAPKVEDLLELKTVADAWNAMAAKAGLPQVATLGKDRERTVRARLQEHGLDSVLVAIDRVGASDFLTGKVEPKAGSQPFLASFDFVTGPKNFRKLIEGNYDNRTGKGGAVREFRRPQVHDGFKEQLKAKSQIFDPFAADETDAKAAAGGGR